jgi:hypothetical protein
VESPYPLGCSRRGGYITLAQNIALFALIGYCPRIGVIDNEKGGIRAVHKNDVRSPHLSLGVRFSCMGTGNHWHEHYGYDRYEHDGNEYYGHYRYHHGNDEHHWHYGNYRHHHRHEHNGYDGHHHKHPARQRIA